MIDIKKLQFMARLRSVIEDNPTWAADSVQAITDGVADAVKKHRDDNAAMACLVVEVMLARKNGAPLDASTRQRVFDIVGKYFDKDGFEKFISQ